MGLQSQVEVTSVSPDSVCTWGWESSCTSGAGRSARSLSSAGAGHSVGPATSVLSTTLEVAPKEEAGRGDPARHCVPGRGSQVGRRTGSRSSKALFPAPPGLAALHPRALHISATTLLLKLLGSQQGRGGLVDPRATRTPNPPGRVGLGSRAQGWKHQARRGVRTLLVPFPRCSSRVFNGDLHPSVCQHPFPR